MLEYNERALAVASTSSSQLLLSPRREYNHRLIAMARRDRHRSIAQGPTDTSHEDYARRLETSELAWWKRLLNVQAPYQWNVHRLNPGVTLDLGCGIGRNLATLGPGSVGVDHNPISVEVARRRGFVAFTPEEFRNSQFNQPESFDTLLASHLLEHLKTEDAQSLLKEYSDLVRPGGLMIFITPQEAGFRRDASHVTFTDFPALGALCETTRAVVERQYSFPFPRRVGRVFPYNEFVMVARLPEKSV